MCRRCAPAHCREADKFPQAQSRMAMADDPESATTIRRVPALRPAPAFAPVSPAPPPSSEPSRLRLLARKLPADFAITVVINLLCALAITYLLRNGQPFAVNLVFAMCIGTLALLFIDGGRLLIWKTGKPARLPFLLLVLASIFAAQQFGNLAAMRLLGLPAGYSGSYSHNAIEYFTATVLASAAATWFFWNRGQLAHAKAEAEAEKARTAVLEKRAMQAQLQLLQAQIEPHMLFNTLANLQGLIALDPPRAQELLDRLILYLRATLRSSRAETTTLAHEFALIDAYLGLMSVRMGARLSYALDLPETLPAADIAPMLLQPLVENAILHGLEPKVEGGRLDVHAAAENGMLVITVADTGLGSCNNSSERVGNGIGLENVRERLRALYGESASLTLHANRPCGSVAVLRIPL